MKATAALAGGFLLLATYPAGAQGVSGSLNVTGGATPSVSASATTGATATGTSSSQSSSDPVITNSGNTGSSVLTNRNGARSNANAQGGRASSTSQGGRASASTGPSTSRAQGGRGGQGGSAGAVGNQVIVEGYTGTGGTTDPSGYTGTSNVNTRYSGSFTQTLRNTPEIVAPSVNGGANGCAVGVSGGVAVAGFGITTGAGWSDSNCERRNLAALVYNTGDHDLAAEILCDAAEVRAARLRMGKPCIADQAPAAVTVGAARVEAVDPAILRRQQDTLASQQPVIRQKPDWCETASPQEIRSHRECN